MPWTLIQHKDVLSVWDEITYPSPNFDRKPHCGDQRVVNRPISKMGFPLLVRWHLYIESAPMARRKHKDHISRYTDPHGKDKNIMRPFYLYALVRLCFKYPWCWGVSLVTSYDSYKRDIQQVYRIQEDIEFIKLLLVIYKMIIFGLSNIYFKCWHLTYRQTSNVRPTKSQNLNVSRFVLQWSLPNPFKPGVMSRMKMELGQGP